MIQWLYSKDIIPTLLSCLGPEHPWPVQTAAGDFIKAIITISANASQNEQQCIGPNELTRQLVSEQCVEQLIGYMLKGGNPLTVGVGIVIEVIRKNNSDYDPDVGTESTTPPSSRDPIYLGTLLRLFAKNVPKFTALISDGPMHKEPAESTFGEKLAPLGFNRFKTCELMAELLHCSNMGLLNEIGAEAFIATRDAERDKLREEGKLGPLKAEDTSTDALEMRSQPQSSIEGRRLEVTNADDDGFEEVEPSKEMSEDTSDEFVKAEKEVQPAAQSATSAAFLEKDGEDFVDEPLSSSPRMAINADKIKEQQQFEEADLVVAPLSPSKPKPAAPVMTSEAATGYHSKSPEPGQDSPVPHLELGETESNQPATIFAPDVPDQPAIKVEPVEDADNFEAELAPHPEDTPAPLFSAPPPPESGADRPPKSAHRSSSSQDMGTTTPPPPAGGSERPKVQTPDPNDPVVGDYLKMQFVEHRVVPTILVG